jgi:uridine kinase
MEQHRAGDENMPYTIAINAVSGGGKTALAKSLQESLPGSKMFCFDDFDQTNKYAEDYYEWWKRGANLLEFDCQGMRDAVDNEIQRGLDYPFGRDHPRFRDVIDLSVYVDTPLDVAMARRIVRDHQALPGESAPDVADRLRAEMLYYVEKGRHVYLDTERHKSNSDLVLDGRQSLEELSVQILAHIRTRSLLKPSLDSQIPHCSLDIQVKPAPYCTRSPLECLVK